MSYAIEIIHAADWRNLVGPFETEEEALQWCRDYTLSLEDANITIHKLTPAGQIISDMLYRLESYVDEAGIARQLVNGRWLGIKLEDEGRRSYSYDAVVIDRAEALRIVSD